MESGEIINNQNVYESTIKKVSEFFGLNNSGSEMIIFIIAIYILLILILGILYNLFRKIYKNNKKKFFFECDNILYKLAKEQYKSKYDNNINIQLLEEVFKSKTNDYFYEKDLLEKKLKEIEQTIGNNIIDESQLSDFKKYYKKAKFGNSISKLIGYILSFLSLGIFKLFS